MVMTDYEATLYADLNKPSVQLLNTLPPSEVSRISRFLRTYVYAGRGTIPSGAPWTGTIALDSQYNVPSMPVVHSLVDLLLDDWNANYALQFLTGSTGPDEGDQALNETFRWVWENGILIVRPNYSLQRVGDDAFFDPFLALPSNPGLVGRLRLQVAIHLPAA